MQWIVQLMEQKRLNSAKILDLQAKAAAAMAGIDEAAAATQLNFLQTTLDALKAHNDMITERIAAMAESGGAGGEGNLTGGGANSNGTQQTPAIPGGIPGMEGGPGDAADMGADAAMEGELEGAME